LRTSVAAAARAAQRFVATVAVVVYVISRIDRVVMRGVVTKRLVLL
jgi:hypothetical protein